MISPPATPETTFDPGSFRDRHGRIFYRGGEVYRAISAAALEDWRQLTATRFYQRFTSEHKIIATELADVPPPPGEWAAVLRHARVPFISYPHEWTFSMLRDAALLQLELLLAALEEDFILKDSSAYNFQWLGGQPVFIDVLSFKKIAAGEVWTGYRQFCSLFLYPLMLQAYRGIPFQPWLRGNVDGISPVEMNSVMSRRDLLRTGVFQDVYLQSKLQEKMADTHRDLRSELRTAGFSKDLIIANARRLLNVVTSLAWKPSASAWSAYTATTSYSSAEAAHKESFVRRAVASRKWQLVWDLGCNTGIFSRIAAGNADNVVAMDADALVVDRLYHSLKKDAGPHILPLVVSLSDTPAGFGWRGRERKSITDRGKPDLVLCLALIHHIVLSANIPMEEFIEWLSSLGSSLLIEFVTREDAMVKKLLLNKDDQYTDYDAVRFEQCLAAHYKIHSTEPIASGSRILYFATPR